VPAVAQELDFSWRPVRARDRSSWRLELGEAGEGTQAGGRGSCVAASGPLCGAGEAGRRRRLGARCRLGGEAVCAAAATAPVSRGQGERAERRVPPPPEPELRLGIEWMGR